MQDRIHKPASTYNYIERALSQDQQIGVFLAEQKHPVLLVSYEKAIKNPLGLYLALAELMGIKKDLKVLEKVIDYIQHDRFFVEHECSSHTHHGKSQAAYEKYYRNVLMQHQKIRAIELLDDVSADDEYDVAVLIRAAEQEMVNGQFQAAITKLERLLSRFETVLPVIIYGPQAVSASLRYSVGQPNIPAVPDVVVKIFYLIGISLLQMSNPQDAIIWFSACFDLATRKLMYKQQGGPLPESEHYFIWAKFHEAFSAKLLASPNLLHEACHELAALKYSSNYLFSDIIKLAYNQAMQRIENELKV